MSPRRSWLEIACINRLPDKSTTDTHRPSTPKCGNKILKQYKCNKHVSRSPLRRPSPWTEGGRGIVVPETHADADADIQKPSHDAIQNRDPSNKLLHIAVGCPEQNKDVCSPHNVLGGGLDDDDDDETSSHLSCDTFSSIDVIKADARAGRNVLNISYKPTSSSESLWKSGKLLRNHYKEIYFLWAFLQPHQIKYALRQKYHLFIWDSEVVQVLTEWYEGGNLPQKPGMQPPRWHRVREQQANPRGPDPSDLFEPDEEIFELGVSSLQGEQFLNSIKDMIEAYAAFGIDSRDVMYNRFAPPPQNYTGGKIRPRD